MLDILFNPERAERHPFEFSLIGIFYSSVAILLGLWLFSVSSSLAIVFLTTISCLYVVQSAIRMEERKEKNYNDEVWTLNQHKPLAVMILLLFLGFVLSFTLWSFFLPEPVADRVFELQQVSLDQIKLLTGNASHLELSFMQILKNNVNIVLISIIFALFFGAGAIYILAWNASVMGYVIGLAAKDSFGLAAIPVVATRYFIHGIPEMFAYIIAAIAGGIMYFALIRGDLTKPNKVKRILTDFVILVLLSLALLVLSALIEVYISPFV